MAGLALMVVSTASGWGVLCHGCSAFGMVGLMNVTLHFDLLQAASFKLMGNFTLFGMVEVMCEVRQHLLSASLKTCYSDHGVHGLSG